MSVKKVISAVKYSSSASQTMCTGTIKLFASELTNLFIISFGFKRFFLIKNNQITFKYFYFPHCFSFKKKNDILIFSSQNQEKEFFDLYLTNFLSWLRSSNKKTKQKLILKGLGFRCFLSDDKTKISFKVGYSHIITLDIPKRVFSITIEKNYLVLEGQDPIILGNFCKKIKELKKIDVYKNKGFSYKSEIIFSKVIKKS